MEKIDKESVPSGGMRVFPSAEIGTHIPTHTHAHEWSSEEHEGSLKISCNIKLQFLNLVKNRLDSYVSLWAAMELRPYGCKLPSSFLFPLPSSLPFISAFISMLLSLLLAPLKSLPYITVTFVPFKLDEKLNLMVQL